MWFTAAAANFHQSHVLIRGTIWFGCSRYRNTYRAHARATHNAPLAARLTLGGNIPRGCTGSHPRVGVVRAVFKHMNTYGENEHMRKQRI